MRRYGFSTIIVVGALWLGVVTLSRGQYWLSVCFIGIGLLRAIMLSGSRKPSQREPEIRLDIMKPSALRYPKLPPHLKPQLDAITPSTDRELKLYPCLVRLNDGREVDRVYVVSEAPYLKHFLAYPSRDRHPAEILVTEVASLTESPSRLPSQFGNELYKAGESGMGDTLFTVVFSDGTRHAFLAGYPMDFIEYPEGKSPQDVASVLPHEGRHDKGRKSAPNYRWCIYSE